MAPELDDLRFLEAFERLGSARAAARELGTAPSTVYRRIASIERAVGVPCVVPGGGVTDAARRLADAARTAHATLSEAVAQTRAERDTPRGRVCLTTLDGFAPLLTDALAELGRAYPNLQVDVDVSDRGRSLRKGHADVGLALLDDPAGELVGRRLGKVRFRIYAARGGAVTPGRERWVTLGPPLDTSWLGKWEAAHVPAARVAMRSPSRRLLVDLVAAGVGVGVLPEPVARLRSELVPITLPGASVGALVRDAWVLHAASRRNDARVRAVVGVLSKHVSALLGGGGRA